MSRRPLKNELPRDAHVVQALRRELHRNSRQITQTFWQEFEQIRRHQRNQLSQERANRERISILMRDANLETQRQAEALSRSISSHGVNPVAPSPRMRREPPAIMPTAAEITQELQSSPIFKRQRSSVESKASSDGPDRTPSSKSPSEQLPSTSFQLPRAPPSSRVTIEPGTPNMRTPPRNSPNISKLQLASKPRK
ncbi:uncharacterized protein LOC135426332 [Drosophila montana]|uniref:uncharacterized protein LOC135426332 n=1 Tax=Drosophila montana TaxID=40370 RepID=UPI00313B4C54